MNKSPMPAAAITSERIALTAELIRPYIRRTPVIEVDGADFGLESVRLVFKLESLQHTGSLSRAARSLIC